MVRIHGQTRRRITSNSAWRKYEYLCIVPWQIHFKVLEPFHGKPQSLNTCWHYWTSQERTDPLGTLNSNAKVHQMDDEVFFWFSKNFDLLREVDTKLKDQSLGSILCATQLNLFLELSKKCGTCKIIRLIFLKLWKRSVIIWMIWQACGLILLLLQQHSCGLSLKSL